jgi:hypothetical protein
MMDLSDLTTNRFSRSFLTSIDIGISAFHGPALVRHQRKWSQIMKSQIHRKILAIAATVMIGVATTGGAALARGGVGGFGGGHMGGGFRGGPYMGGVISTPPVFNPSSGYTVPTSPEAPVSPASPGSVFH